MPLERPSWGTGFARSAGECSPEWRWAWDGLVYAGCPFLGPIGKTLYDLSGNGNHGALVNGPTWGPGQEEPAIAFTYGNDHYISLVSSESLRSAARECTLIMRQTTTIASGFGFRDLFQVWGGVGDASWRFGVNVGGGYNPIYVSAQIHSGGSTTTYDGANINMAGGGDWHDIGMTIRGTTLNLYVDGKLDNPHAIGVPDNNPSSFLMIGEDKHQVDVSLVYLYNRALSAQAVALLYSDRYAMFVPDYVPFFVPAAGSLWIPRIIAA